MLRGLVAVLAALLFGMAATPAAAAPLEAYGRLPQIENISVSPDGTMLALTVTNGEQRTVVIRKTDDPRPLALITAGAKKLRDVDWAGNGFLMITASVTSQIAGVTGQRGEYFTTVLYELATKRQRPLIQRISDTLNLTAGTPRVRIIDGKPVIFVEALRFQNGSGRRALLRISPVDNTIGQVDSGEGAGDWVLDDAGRPLAMMNVSGESGVWTIRLRRAAGWAVAQNPPDYTDTPGLMGMGRTPGTILVGGPEGGRMEVRELGIEDGRWSDPLPLTNFDSLIFDPGTHRPVGSVRLTGNDLIYEFLDPRDTAIWRVVQSAYRNQRVSLAGWSDDRTKLVVKVDSPTEGPAYALVDLKTKRAAWIGPVYKDIGAQDVAEVRAISYQAADGLEITGYLTLPRGRDPRNLPLIVLPHGGPAARDEPGFDWWSQALASRGYAVLQPNFRGSDGFGTAFLRAGFGQWGKKMQTDLSDGVRYLAGQGLIDPKRVCIVGASYGGYAALAGAAIDTGVYRCAASVAGVADLPVFLRWTRANNGMGSFSYWLDFLDSKSSRDDDLAEISPAAQAARVTIPVLLVHGKDDTVVPYAQSQIMADALRRAGRPVTFVTLEGEDHWLSTGATRLQMLQAVVAFLEANNPPT